MADPCANPLLAKWLKEWMDKAKEQNSKGYTVYKKAYQSMIACPMRFHHPSEAQQLNGLGPKLCDRLADKLKAHCEENGMPMPVKGKQRKRPSEAQGEESAQEEQESPKRKRKAQPYVPKLRSGGYALIMALSTLDQESNQAISKEELKRLAQPHCDASFDVPPDPTKFYTAWQSIKLLESKELVCTKGHPIKKYYLSDEGWEVALRMNATVEGCTIPVSKSTDTKKTAARPTSPSRSSSLKTSQNVGLPITARQSPSRQRIDTAKPLRNASTRDSNVIDLLSSPAPEAGAGFSELVTSGFRPLNDDIRPLSKGTNLNDTVVLPAGSFEVRMVLDMREIRSRTDRDYISSELKKQDVNPILTALPLGDVLWVAVVDPSHAETLRQLSMEDRDKPGESWIVLEHILERKRLDDLIGSIKDGRFREQKFRLHKSGIKNVVYLVEAYSLSSEKSEKYGDAVESAIASMQVVDDVFVKQTAKLDDTISYLARMTKTLKGLYERKDIHVIPTDTFEAEAASTILERLRSLSPQKTYGMTFSLFGAMCDKSDSMTLRDVYLKMLMCTRGVTGEKAVEIQKIWPTPRALAEAFDTMKTIPEKENMISSRLANAIPKKKVAKALSAKIAEVWG
ncbi:Crossover junction endonuclease mus81 [Knufia peltigerae]|uniref:Crossover junction endonuclease MUS81 n=1 Tax=Knufia peltigerae TaxID=1002370 RepID=A0AA38XYP7_9EURO|nr:Crossover junction endonuclease mus81 [Knufia peltigerae]